MNEVSALPVYRLISLYAPVCKKGEVVEPAGGETGGPRCLAEVQKPRNAALLQNYQPLFKLENNSVKLKAPFFLETLCSSHHYTDKALYSLLSENASRKSLFFIFLPCDLMKPQNKTPCISALLGVSYNTNVVNCHHSELYDAQSKNRPRGKENNRIRKRCPREDSKE